MAVFVEGVFSQDRNADSELRGKKEGRGLERMKEHPSEAVLPMKVMGEPNKGQRAHGTFL